MGMRPQTLVAADVRAAVLSPPLGLYGVSYVAAHLGISRGYVSFLARHRIAPFLPTHVCQGEAGTRSQALFTAERVVALAHSFRHPREPVLPSGEVLLLYGITYLAVVLGYSRNRISPLVQERVSPFWPTHMLRREDGRPGIALFTAERIQHIVQVRCEQALCRHYAASGPLADGPLLGVGAHS